MNPRRGEVWHVDLEPTRGVEIQKMRPCIVVSADTAGTLPIRLVTPLTGWQSGFDGKFWFVKIKAGVAGLTKDSAADTLQTRGVDVLRFGTYHGTLPSDVMREVTNALLLTIGYVPDAAANEGSTP